MARLTKGFFYRPSHTTVVCFRPERETLRKDLTAEAATAFIWPHVKNLRKMKTISNGRISPEQILNDLLDTDEISRMRQHLRDMIDAYLLSEDEHDYPEQVYTTFQTIDELLKNLVRFEQGRRVA